MADKKVEIEYIAKDKTKKATKSVEKNLFSLGNVAKTVGPLITASFGAAAIVSVVRTTAAFEKLNAMLVTATGSANNADEAFSNLKDFASTTPFQLGEVVDAFIKMKNLGLDPTNDALTSFGNTASAMGKDLNQLIEAVADAATGEFERLKEFGIKSKSEGENVSFTFQGVTTTVRKSSEEITGYLEALGNEKFSGAMVLQMETLDGIFSNISDSLDRFSNSFGTAVIDATGFREVLKDIPGIINRIDRSINGIDDRGRIKEIGVEINALERDMAGLNNLPMMPELREDRIQERVDAIKRLREEAATLQSNIDSAPEGAPSGDSGRVERNQQSLTMIAEQEQGAFELHLALAQAAADERSMIEEGQQDARLNRLMEMKQAELSTEEAIRASKQTTANLAVSLLSFLGQKNKAFALLALGVQKGLDISKVISAGLVAQTTALALPPGIAEAKILQIKAITGANVALIAGLGLAQAASIGGGGGAGGGGATGGQAPITQPQATGNQDGGNVTVVFEGDFIGDEQLIENKILPGIDAALRRGVTTDIVIRGN